VLPPPSTHTTLCLQLRVCGWQGPLPMHIQLAPERIHPDGLIQYVHCTLKVLPVNQQQGLGVQHGHNLRHQLTVPSQGHDVAQVQQATPNIAHADVSPGQLLRVDNTTSKNWLLAFSKLHHSVQGAPLVSKRPALMLQWYQIGILE
jgi:hypothetical protein